MYAKRSHLLQKTFRSCVNCELQLCGRRLAGSCQLIAFGVRWEYYRGEFRACLHVRPARLQSRHSACTRRRQIGGRSLGHAGSLAIVGQKSRRRSLGRLQPPYSCAVAIGHGSPSRNGDHARLLRCSEASVVGRQRRLQDCPFPQTKPPGKFNNWLEYAILTFNGHDAALNFMFDAEPLDHHQIQSRCSMNSMRSGHSPHFRRGHLAQVVTLPAAIAAHGWAGRMVLVAASLQSPPLSPSAAPPHSRIRFGYEPSGSVQVALPALRARSVHSGPKKKPKPLFKGRKP